MSAHKKKSFNKNLPEGWEIKIAETFEEIEGIRAVWEKMQSSESAAAIDTDIDRYLSVMETRKDIAKPYVIIFFDKSLPAAMVIAKIEPRPVDIKLGYKTILKPSLKCLTITYDGILGKQNEQLCSLIMRVLMAHLQQKIVDMVYFNHLEKNSLIYRMSREMTGYLTRSNFPVNEKHWLMSVPDSIEQFYDLCSSVSRKQYKKIKRKLEQEYPDRIKIVIYNLEDELDEGIKAAEKISKTTYQWGLGFGFKDDERNRTLLTMAARKGWLRLHVLYIDSEPCAFENWFKYRNKYIGHGIGFNPEWKQWRIGTYLFLDTIERLCNEDSVEIIDFGFGDAEYKQSYGNSSWDEVSVNIFAYRIYPVFVNMLQTFFAAVNSGLKYTAEKFGFINRVKRIWRNRAIKVAS